MSHMHEKTMNSHEEELKSSIIEKLKAFDIRGEKQFQEKYPSPFKTAAVLLPLKVSNGDVYILLTKRAKTLRSHASEAAFPGGMIDDSDSSIVSAALREADEEIGLPPHCVEVLGVLNRGITARGKIVYPVVGFIPNDFQPNVNPSEVEFAFFIPLKDFLSEDKIHISHMQLQFTTYISRSLYYKEGEREAHIFGFTSLFCIFLAKIIFDQTDPLEFFVGSTSNTGRVSDTVEEYFQLCYRWNLMTMNSPKF